MLSNIRLLIITLLVFFIKTAFCQPIIDWQTQETFYRYTKAHKKTKYNPLRNTKFQLQDTTFIDTSVVYISKNKVTQNWYLPGYDNTGYYFIRFFKNGQYFESGLFHSIPSDDECNNLTYGERGYYKIKKDNTLVVATYINPYDGYLIAHYRVGENGLFLFKTVQFKWLCSFFQRKKRNIFYPLEKREIRLNTSATW